MIDKKEDSLWRVSTKRITITEIRKRSGRKEEEEEEGLVGERQDMESDET